MLALRSLVLVLLIQLPLLAATLSGVVTTPDKNPIAGANILLPTLRLHEHSNADGTFSIPNLPAGNYTVRVHKSGFPPQSVEVHLSEPGKHIEIELALYSIRTKKVVISGFRPTDEADFSQSATVIEGKKLDRERGQNLLDSVRDIPGVVAESTGNAVAKPVMRGLSAYRSLLLLDGVPEEAQQFGDEHGPNMDNLDMARIEIIRGPQSLIFGAGAMGGAMNIVTPPLPSSAEGSERLSAKLIGDILSNNPGGAGALSLSGAAGKIGYRGSFSYRETGDTRTPNSIVPNSNYKNWNGSTLIGIQEKWGFLSLRASHYDTTIHLPEATTDASGRLIADIDATTYQHVTHDRFHLHGLLQTAVAKFETNVSFQQNVRREFETSADTSAALHLLLQTVNVDIKAHHTPLGHLLGTWGISYVNQQNRTLGEEALIPAYISNTYSGYIFEELRFEKLSLLGALRADTRLLDARENSLLATNDTALQTSALTGSLGIVWRIVEGASLFTNIGRAFRAPTAFELFSNGVHEGTSTFEKGNASLKEETSLMAELGFKLKSNDFTMNITGYTNKIENYIFSSPTGTFFTDIGGSVYPEYSTTQGNATIYGIEADAEYTLTEWLAFLGGGDFIRGRNDSLNEALPLIPANRFHAGVTFTGKKIMGILNPYLQMKARYTARKSELSNDEKRLYSSFADYALLSLKTGGDFAVGSALWTYTLGVDNLLNQKYVDYLSRQKLFTLNPGINVYFKITAPIDLIH